MLLNHGVHKKMGLTQHHFVLVHGGGHGAWCWVRVIPGLEKAGHRVTTVDLFSAGDHPGTADDCPSFEHYNQPLEDLFKSFPDDEKVVLVGHSLGGMSLTYISEHFPKNISVAVYLSAFMPGPGGNIFEMIVKDPTFMPPIKWEYFYKVEGGPPTSQGISSPDLKEFFYNESSPEDLEIAVKKVRPIPEMTKSFAPIEATKEKYGSVPKVFVLALKDKAIIPSTAHKMIQHNPPDEIIEINSDHSMFFSALDNTITVLLHVATKYDT